MSKVLVEDVLFVKSPVGEGADKELANLKDGQVALYENNSYYKSQEAKDDDMTERRKQHDKIDHGRKAAADSHGTGRAGKGLCALQ